MTGGVAAEVVVLVDGADRETGRAEKLWAHRGGGVRHRAFSVMLKNGRGEWLLQRRAEGKYHFPGLWTNACCSHPRPGEGTEAAAHRRLKEELGVDCPLEEAFAFEYRATSAATGLKEHEVDHVFVGRWEGAVEPDAGEVGAVRWASGEAIDAELGAAPERFTPWFALLWKRMREKG
ncbi:MAG: isopentenyl-diphosphate Delta-isomerase [Kiritimatiellae bacterium]|nr:isopentenyl-diphosphate Delta-isomerase [Kiritimatiellia bacterium]